MKPKFNHKENKTIDMVSSEWADSVGDMMNMLNKRVSDNILKLFAYINVVNRIVGIFGSILRKFGTDCVEREFFLIYFILKNFKIKSVVRA